MAGADRISVRGKVVSGMVRDRLLPWLAQRDFAPNPFLEDAGGYYPGNDVWIWYVARLETPTRIALLDVIVDRRPAAISFRYHPVALEAPVARLADAPGPSPAHEGVLDRRHLLTHMTIAGTLRRPLGLHWIARYRLRGFRNFDHAADKLFDRIAADLDFDRIRAVWQAAHRIVTLGPDGRVIDPPA